MENDVFVILCKYLNLDDEYYRSCKKRVLLVLIVATCFVYFAIPNLILIDFD